jgi:hypothetical protein
MPMTRRSVLLGSAAAAFGLATGSCSLIGSRGGTRAGLPDPKDVTGALQDLVKQAGRETFQSVKIYSEKAYHGMLVVELLMDDGGVQTYTYSGSWKKDKYDEKSILTSPASVRIADLPLDRLTAYADATKTPVDTLAFTVDYVGKLRVEAFTALDWVGLKDDATGTVAELSPDDVSGVRSAIAEMVAAYGTGAQTVGSFNGFVHMDANVAGCHAAVRIIRYPRVPARAGITQETLYNPSELFDPSGFDPTTALTRKATIAKDAAVDGTVWDWEYRRPPQGGEPLVSFGIGPKGPSTRVWLDKNGKVAAVVGGECAASSGWCPK